MAEENGQAGEGPAVAGESKPKLTIDIVSDTMCPWCFVGKKNLEKAMALSKDKYDFEVIWRPFQLNPDAAKEGKNKRNYYRQKFGEAKTKMIIERMTQVFDSLGYVYNMDGLVGNSLDSHRLLEFAKEQDKQNEVCEELFLNSFVRAKYNGDMDNLVEAAETAGITGAREFLEDPDAGLSQVRDDLRTYARGVTGVPHFIINGQVELSGAQPPTALLEAFEDALSAVA
ncbi:Thioredoxin superfamily protein [Klebsormidium nitens]|uniref:Thioredoxin superfamily protein n=1 Tax=Klebsormidium nitens TaxID=105231 RepID=A0A1Y1I1V8_KLENI|nr:Thioredoxin superfamily protein [Klebsormidium nitens]|eukprot:GAQ82727.1 Thioredoxin superfamily protein [Klebsormidium nitens]